MKLYSVNAGHFKLDGGAMFGVVPKSLWNKRNPADDNNMCSWAMRCMLVEDGDRLILIDNGMGNKQDEKFFGYYYLHGDDTLEKSLAAHGFSFDDVTDVFLTHLHFDHCGGSIQWDSAKNFYEPAFKNAIYWSNEAHWNWAIKPNAREKASFLKENIFPIQESGQLKFVEKEGELFENFSVKFVSGHTEAMMLPIIDYMGKKLIYMADLIPSSHHVPYAWVMGYDTRPLLTLEEKETLLPTAADEGHILFFEHDPTVECATVQRTERGIRLGDSFSLNEFFGN